MAALTIVSENANDPTPENFEADFDTFWLLYPRHEAKKDARKAWEHMAATDHLMAVVAITDWRGVWRVQGRDITRIPLAATWLNGERWTDELPSTATTHQSHMPMTPNKPSERSEMPQYVKDMIAKLKTKK